MSLQTKLTACLSGLNRSQKNWNDKQRKKAIVLSAFVLLSIMILQYLFLKSPFQYKGPSIDNPIVDRIQNDSTELNVFE